MPFATLATLPGRKVFSGITGHYVHLDHLTCGEVALDAGAVVPTHQHPHEQVTYVISGRFEFTVGAEEDLELHNIDVSERVGHTR